MIKQRGFTLLEIVIATSLLVLITTTVLQGFSPWMKFKQRLDTTQNLKDLSQAATAFYKANAFAIDDTDLVSTQPDILGGANGTLFVSATANIESVCPSVNVGADPGDTTLVEAEIAPLQPYLNRTVAEVARDGFNNALCVAISPRQFRDFSGTRLYYHTIAFISPGENNALDPGTQFVQTAPGVWTLSVTGDDTGSTVDGFQIAMYNYEVTLERLQRLAKAYESYFNVRYLMRSNRDIAINYFYANDGTNNGDPGNGGPDPGPTVVQSRTILGNVWVPASFDNVILGINNPPATGPVKIASALGVAETDGYNAWGMPILFDNRSDRVKAGSNSVLVRQQPPFTATFGTLLPGSSDACALSGDPNNPGSICITYVTATAVGSY
jgi:prepilin-type N-terminal cleavage/methylation domain-containing protein